MIISIEGNIGSGKSTIFNFLKNILSKNDFYFVDEPVEEWLKIRDEKENIIEKFYKNQKKYAFSFQMMAYISRLKNLQEAIKNNPNKIIITERNIMTDKNIFAKMLYHQKKIDQINYKIYNQWFNYFLQDLPIIKYIYIRTNPLICAERIIKRNRKGEKISLEYLNDCHQYHESWFEKEDKIVIKTDNDFINDFEILNNIREKILDFKKEKFL
jgi:deoxyadenosine/deoxycytidine kinase